MLYLSYIMANDKDSELITLEALALALTSGGKSRGRQPKPSRPAAGPSPLAGKVKTLLGSDSGENGLTCEQAMSAHCSQKCTTGALDILKQVK